METNRYTDTLNPKLWVICGMCGSGDITAETIRDMHDFGDHQKDGVRFRCVNCSTIFSEDDLPLEPQPYEKKEK